MFNKMLKMIADGSAVKELTELLIQAIPAIILGVIFIGGYIIASKAFETKNQPEKATKMKNIAPYLYLVFLAALYLSPIGILSERQFDPTFVTTVGHLFHFIKDIVLFIPLALLLHVTKKNYALSIVVPVVSAVVFEALQYITMFGVATVRNVIAATIGTLVGLIIAIIVNNSKKSKEQKAG